MAQTFQDLAVRYMTDLIRDFDLADFQAAGIVGNGGHESGGFTQIQELNPTVAGSAGGLGHFQWTGRTPSNNRRLLFEQWLARNADKGWTASSYEANYSMLFRELIGTERAALEAVARTTTLEDATRVFCEKFERPSIVHMDSRMAWAQKALTAFQASGVDADKLRAQDRPGTVGEVLPPQPRIDLNSLAPLILGVLAMLQQRQPGGQTQPGQQPDLLSLLLPLLTGGQPQLPPPVVALPPVVVAPAPTEPKTSVGVGLIGLLGSVLGMVGGQIGTPFGMGEAPTTAGTLSVVIPAAISAIGATGIFGPFGAILGRIVSGAVSGVRTK